MIYLSHFLGPDIPFYGGEGVFKIEPLRSMTNGDPCNSSLWSFQNHSGTHIDFPLHFVKDGKSLDDYTPDFWKFTKVAVIEISSEKPPAKVTPELLKPFEECLSGTEILLLKTGMGRYRYEQNYWHNSPVFIPELAEYLRSTSSAIRALGVDTISISSWTNRSVGRNTHKAFLSGERPILLIEDMDLSIITNKTIITDLIVAPLLVREADAAPCTVIAEVIS